MRTLTIITFIVIIAIMNELICAYMRYTQGKVLYNTAKDAAVREQIPLIVIGNPTASWKNYIMGPSYGCGDLCIDIAGCKCSNLEKRTKSLEALSTLNSLSTNSVVVFESGTKHLVPGLEEEMNRVGGNNVYTVNLNDTSLILFLSHYTGSIFT